MTEPPGRLSPRFVYERRYIEPAIELAVLEPSRAAGEQELRLLRRVSRYRPTGTRTPSGYYEYELVEESSIP